MALGERTRQMIQNNFTYHPPDSSKIHGGMTQAERYDAIRNMARAFTTQVCEMIPESREQALFLTHLENACFWANAAIARNE